MIKDIEALYARAYGRKIEPFYYQRQIAEADDVDVLIAPTGLGKTAAITLGWIWRRLKHPQRTPRRLIWCLPMRSLVEQTASEARRWLEPLADDFAEDFPVVHTLMGGRVETDWRLTPEAPAILVGTQDMLLSRALMRGYGMSRFGWPIDFGLLHSDALWVFDEVQLMGASLATSAQLEAFRRRRGGRARGLASSLWVSATLDPSWLSTAEFQREIPEPTVRRWNDDNPPEPPILSSRLDALKPLRRASTLLTANAAEKPVEYAKTLAREIKIKHIANTTTLVIVNTVRRAQLLYAALAREADETTENLLIHSRFRAADRMNHEGRLLAGKDADRIVVATQAVEAGIDLTSALLFTELAPWSSLVQRFGRCNRTGERNDFGGSEVFWIDVEASDGAVASKPYEDADLAEARDVLSRLDEVSPRSLPAPSKPTFPDQVIRPKDFEELFDTDSDLSGFDIDISPYIRETDERSISLFWRAVGDQSTVDAPTPHRDELCTAPLSKALETWLTPKGRKPPVYVADSIVAKGNRWIRLDRSGQRLRPGLTLMLDVGMGGYDADRGFVGAEATQAVDPVNVPTTAASVFLEGSDADVAATTDSDPQSFDYQKDVPLETHLKEVAQAAHALAISVGLSGSETAALVRAGAWHDLGKAYAPFQGLLGRAADGPLLAKSAKQKKPAENSETSERSDRPQSSRRFFRHELASALGFLQQHDGETDADLVAFLIACHHGKIRMGLRALPKEEPYPASARIARGVQDGDELPQVMCGDETSAPQTLSLDLMEMGEDAVGRRSWAARTQRLLALHGPFRLAYLEALLRMADWRASKSERSAGARHA